MNMKYIKPGILIFLMLIVLPLESLFADGFIIITDTIGPRHRPRLSNPFPLEVKYHTVKTTIEERAATTKIDQEFYNPSNRRLEGHYIFPIPRGAVIKRFSMYINGKETPAELLDAKKARKIYEDIVRRELDPAILEYQGMDIFKARIFPIEPHSSKRVKISYTQILNKDSGTIEYIYPLNTEKFSAKPLKNVSVTVNIHSKDILKNIYCTSHDVDIVRKGNNHALVTFEEKNSKPDTDFKLYYSTNNSKIGFSLLTYKEKGEDGYFLLSASPGFVKKNEINVKDITFVLDVSGSMAGEKLEQAKKALRFCIANLNREDRFQIIRFSTEAEALFTGLKKAHADNRKKARGFVNKLKAIGGTHIEEALSLALKAENSPNRSHMILFITDGKPTIGETNEQRLIKKMTRSNSSNTRIFTFGIGYDINTHLLDKITKQTRAYRTYIPPKEDIEIKISNFYTKVQSPVLSNLKLRFLNGIRVSKTYPRELPDLFKGSSLTILGRYRTGGTAGILLTGKVKNRVQQFRYSGKFAGYGQKNDFIPSLWAARRIGYLLDQIRLHGENKELVDEITILARKHGIVTPYTSYLILEDERRRVSRRRLREEYQTLGRMAPAASDFVRRNREEYSSLKSKSGMGSVRASKEVQSLNKAYNTRQTRQGEKRLRYKDFRGAAKNMARQVKNIQGRAVYNAGKFWIDSRLQLKKNKKAIRVRFASKKYFKLLRKEPLAAQFMALGKNVRFSVKNRVYEVYE
ncbi:MAG: VWA domain-containing protein [bacterium]|nr:VWA domain-containing protein [bacterium]